MSAFLPHVWLSNNTGCTVRGHAARCCCSPNSSRSASLGSERGWRPDANPVLNPAMLIGNCLDCNSTELHARGRCTPCYWKAKREAEKQTCPTCQLWRVLVPDAGICGMCVRRARPRKLPTPRICDGCGRMAIHDGLGLCSPCYQRDPARVATWTEGALTRLGDNAPHWFVALAQDLRERCTAPKATFHLRRVEQLLAANISEPAALIDALATPGRSPGATTRLLDEFFVRVGIGGHLDETNRLAAGRRMRRLSRVPEVLRPAVEAFAQHLR